MPLRESFGGARRLLGPEDEPALACSFSEVCGTVGQTAVGGLGNSLLSRSGGLCGEASECDESEFADPGVGPLTDDNDKDEGEDDFTGGFWGCVS